MTAADPRDLDEPVVELPEISGSDFVEFIEAGQWSESRPSFDVQTDEEAARHRVREPDAVGRQEERVARLLHRARVDATDDGLAPTAFSLPGAP